MSILDLLGNLVIDIETNSREEDNGYLETFVFHVNFADGQPHTSLEALAYLATQGVKRGSAYPDPNFELFARKPKAANFEDLRDYFLVTVDYGPREPDNTIDSFQSPLTARTEVTWQSTLVDNFITEDADGVPIAATNGQIIGETVPLPLFEGKAVWNQSTFDTGQFDDKIGKINTKGFRMGGFYFKPSTFMPTGVSDGIGKYRDQNDREKIYYIITLPFSYRPTGFKVTKRMQGNYFLSPAGTPVEKGGPGQQYYPRGNNGSIIRDLVWDLKEDGSVVFKRRQARTNSRRSWGGACLQDL